MELTDLRIQQYGLIEVKLQGLGEPLLNPDFFKMVDYTVDRCIWVQTTANASLLHLNENYKRMIDSKIGEIQISIDGAMKETFENIRKGSNFESNGGPPAGCSYMKWKAYLN